MATYSPESSTDPHTIATRELLAALESRFPGAGLGVAGSVGRGTHTRESDIDLLVVGEFEREMSFGVLYGGIEVALLCKRPFLDPGKAADLVRSARIDDVTPFVLGARVVRDPAGHLRSLQHAFAGLAAARENAAAARRVHLDGRATLLVRRALEAVEPGREGPLLFELLSLILVRWCLEYGVVLDDKEKSLRLFDTIAELDSEFHALLATALPLCRDSVPVLSRCLERLASPVPRSP